MPASVASAPVHRTATKTTASRTKKSVGAKSAPKAPQTNGAVNGAASYASPYGIMASRIANRVAEMAENMTFVERERPQSQPQTPTSPQTKKPPRKLEMRIPNTAGGAQVTFSAPFLDNTLSKLLALQNRMLQVSQEIAASDDVEDKVKKEQYNQSAELSRIIALICAEKARQGA